MNKINDISGVIFLDKPKWLTSNKCLTKIKKLFNIKKAGFIGILDPLATGILPICLGEATKYSNFLSNSDKYYFVEAKLGITTNTFDITGILINYSLLKINIYDIYNVIILFKGKYLQTPSIFSAKKIKGIPAYEYARKNININIKPRIVYIYNIDIINYNNNILTLIVHCSKGTYIRCLINDIGKKLKCGACVNNIRRIQISNYINEYYLIKYNKLKIIKNISKIIFPIDILLNKLYTINLNKLSDIKKFINGNYINNINNINNNTYLKITGGKKKFFLGVGKIYNKYIIPFRLLKNLSYKNILI